MFAIITRVEALPQPADRQQLGVQRRKQVLAVAFRQHIAGRQLAVGLSLGHQPGLEAAVGHGEQTPNDLAARHRDDDRPLDVTCSSHAGMSVRSPEGQVSGGFSRVYRHHLERCDEMSAPMLASIHRLHYDINLMREFRGALDQGRYAAWRTGLHADRVRGVG